MLCKDVEGRVVPWAPADAFRAWTHASEKDRKSPLTRISQLFNVNHFIVSQARPYLVPFLQSDMHGPSPPPSLLTRLLGGTAPSHGGASAGGARHGRDREQLTSHLFQVVGLELRHRLRQLDALGLLGPGVRRFLVDEEVPGAVLTLVPDVAPADFVRLLRDTPDRPSLDRWIRRGERSVYPAIAALTVRCAVELELERAYQRARRLKAGGLRRKASVADADLGAGAMGTRLGVGIEFEQQQQQQQQHEQHSTAVVDAEEEVGSGFG